ncbi:response regulator [Nitrospira sp. NS4]|uniref:response regulator n=1 Tax=Nitrospira sp. NS4 TaxID=3414498 RepID=UPI003C2B6008
MRNLRVLEVDDAPALRGLPVMRLEHVGSTVETAEAGWDGLSKLASAGHVVVLLDYMMPGITGLKVLQHMQVWYPSVPVVMTTAR